MEFLRATGTKFKKIFVGTHEKKQRRCIVKEVPSTSVKIEVANTTKEVTKNSLNPEPILSENTDQVLLPFSQELLKQIFGKQKEPYHEDNYKKQAHQLYEYALKESIDVQLLRKNPELYCEDPRGQTLICEHLEIIHREHLAFISRREKKSLEDLDERKELLLQKQEKLVNQQKITCLLQEDLLERQKLVIEKQKRVNDKLEKHLKLGTYRRRYLHEMILDMFNFGGQGESNTGGISAIWGFITGAAFMVPRLFRKLCGFRRTFTTKTISV